MENRAKESSFSPPPRPFPSPFYLFQKNLKILLYEKVLLGIEPRSQESKSRVLTTTL